MVQIHDIRNSRAYQDAYKEGFEEGFQEGIEIAFDFVIAKMAKKGMSPEKIAYMLDLDMQRILQALSKPDRDWSRIFPAEYLK